MEQYQYLVISEYAGQRKTSKEGKDPEAEMLQSLLNKYAKEGWRAIDIRETGRYYSGSTYQIVFERRALGSPYRA